MEKKEKITKYAFRCKTEIDFVLVKKIEKACKKCGSDLTRILANAGSRKSG